MIRKGFQEKVIKSVDFDILNLFGQSKDRDLRTMCDKKRDRRSKRNVWWLNEQVNINRNAHKSDVYK